MYVDNDSPDHHSGPLWCGSSEPLCRAFHIVKLACRSSPGPASCSLQGAGVSLSFLCCCDPGASAQEAVRGHLWNPLEFRSSALSPGPSHLISHHCTSPSLKPRNQLSHLSVSSGQDSQDSSALLIPLPVQSWEAWLGSRQAPPPGSPPLTAPPQPQPRCDLSLLSICLFDSTVGHMEDASQAVCSVVRSHDR